MKYGIIDKTPAEACIIGGCPKVYEVTSKAIACVVGGCPGIYKAENGNYLLIGLQVNKEQLKDFDLEGKVGEGEMAILVPKDLIDKIER